MYDIFIKIWIPLFHVFFNTCIVVCLLVKKATLINLKWPQDNLFDEQKIYKIIKIAYFVTKQISVNLVLNKMIPPMSLVFSNIFFLTSLISNFVQIYSIGWLDPAAHSSLVRVRVYTKSFCGKKKSFIQPLYISFTVKLLLKR